MEWGVLLHEVTCKALFFVTCSYQACLEIRFEPPKLTEHQQGLEIVEIIMIFSEIHMVPC